MESFWGWVIESSLLILMVLGIRRIFAGKVQYAVIRFLWVVVFLRFLVPVNLISTPYSAGNLFKTFVSSVKDKEAELSMASAGTASKESGDGASLQGQGIRSLTTVSLEKQMGENTALSAQKELRTGLEEKTDAAEEKRIGRNGERLRGFRWLVSGILLLWFFLSNCILTRRFKRERVFYRKKGGLSVYQVSGIKSPCLYGIFCPAIYIPKGLVLEEQVNAVEMEQILTHEYVHFKHKDHILSVLQMILSAVYFFDPFLLYAVSCSKKDTELFCDETVIGLLGEKNRFAYGKMLIRLAGEVHFTDFRYAMLTMSRRGREMEKRIRAIGKKRNYSKRVLLPVVLIAAIGLSVTCSAGTVSFAGLRKEFPVSERKEKEVSAVLKQETEHPEAEDTIPSEDIEESIRIYTEFLKEKAAVEGFAYYSFVSMGKGFLVLLVTDTVDELTEGVWGSSFCTAYRIDGKTVAENSEIACDANEWLRVSDGVLWLGTKEAIVRAELSSDAMELSFRSAERKSEELSEKNKEYMTWLGEYAKAPGVAFYENPFASAGGETDARLTFAEEDFQVDIYAAGKLSSLYVEELYHTFEKYWEFFTEAVNTGKTDKLELVLDKESEAYQEQCKWAKNYYQRKFREKVKRAQIVSMDVLSPEEEVVHANEVIRITYSDGSKKNRTQQYSYIFKYTENGWRITYMESEDWAEKS